MCILLSQSEPQPLFIAGNHASTLSIFTGVLLFRSYRLFSFMKKHLPGVSDIHGNPMVALFLVEGNLSSSTQEPHTEGPAICIRMKYYYDSKQCYSEFTEHTFCLYVQTVINCSVPTAVFPFSYYKLGCYVSKELHFYDFISQLF